MPASVLGLRASEFVYKPFKSEVVVFYSTQFLLIINLFGFQRQMLTELIFLMRFPGLGCLIWGLNPLLLREDLCLCDSPFCLWVATAGM